MILRWGSRMLERTSPVGLALGVIALAFTLPPVRRGLRKAAVTAVAGVLSVSDSLKAPRTDDNLEALRENDDLYMLEEEYSGLPQEEGGSKDE